MDVSGRVWWNGRILPAGEASIPCDDAGFLRGDGVFETLAVHAGFPLFLERHLDRLRRGLALLEIAPVSADLARHACEFLGDCAPPGPARARITVTAGRVHASGRAGGEPHVLMSVSPYRAPASYAEDGVAVGISAAARQPHPLHGIKSTSYAAADWLRREGARSGCFDVLQANTAGHWAEGAFTNLFAVTPDGVLRTPAVEDGCLPGVTRAVILELAAGLHMPTALGGLTVPELAAADEVFLTGSLCGVVPVHTLGGRAVAGACPGPQTRALREAYSGRVAAEIRRLENGES